MISYVDHDGDYFGLIAGVSGPKTLHYGHRFNPICPEVRWEEIQELVKQTGFVCARCGSDVLINRKGTTQLCRCARVAYEPGYEFKTGDEWMEWQTDFDRQLADPAPKDYWIDPGQNSEGGPQGKKKIMSKAGKEWMKRKLELPLGLEISDDGSTMRLPGSKGSLSVAKGGNLTAIDLPDDEDGLQFFLAAQRIHEIRESSPKAILVLGDDPDYVWPSVVNPRLIHGLPFSCGRCGRRVKEAPISTSRILVCLCLQAFYPPGADQRPPRTRQEWDRLRVEVAAETTRARAVTAGVDN
jgi:hypothetical protein